MERLEDAGLFSVAGVRGSAVRSGVKPSGGYDLAVVRFDQPMTAVGMFTTNHTAAAPVLVSRETLAQSSRVSSFVVNSGNANALTGPDGERHARAMKERVEAKLGAPGLVFSTGVIGVPLPVDEILNGIDKASEDLSDDGGEFADAILTTDSCSKRCAVRLVLSDGDQVTVGGVAKGSGMIHPNLATMLAFMVTDARVDAGRLRTMLSRAVDASFHAISVDGDTSTNDAVMLFARERASADESLSDGDRSLLTEAITWVARDLARQIIEDGEGATRVMEIAVEGAQSDHDARSVASAIACSSLVKTALAGGDPNWGRMLSAAGTAGVPFAISALTLQIGGHTVFADGRPLKFSEASVSEAFSGSHVSIRLSLGSGLGSSRMLTTDLSKRYVQINSEYTT